MFLPSFVRQKMKKQFAEFVYFQMERESKTKSKRYHAFCLIVLRIFLSTIRKQVLCFAFLVLSGILMQLFLSDVLRVF